MSAAEQFLELLRRDGRVCDPQAALTPLAGGVSSDIFLVRDGLESFVAKRALAKLRVQEDWYANVGRNATEQAYIQCVSRFLPGAVPELIFASEESGYFTMEFIGLDFANWKELLLGGLCRAAHAAQAGEILGTIHRRTAGDAEVARKFRTTADFRQLRLEPYLLTTGARHPDLREFFESEAGRLAATHEALVHGDFSPKNIMISDARMVVLDCEVAWYGDPTFDAAFLLNHFFLKALHHAPADHGLPKMVAAFWRAYSAARENGDARIVEQRLVPLLLMLLLARVDGKSPVEYLTEPKRQFIRDFVGYYLPSPPDTLALLSKAWFAQVFNSAPVSTAK
jgi:aminoglycoside phosphotransferase (APT) family kinase protein